MKTYCVVKEINRTGGKEEAELFTTEEETIERYRVLTSSGHNPMIFKLVRIVTSLVIKDL